jgi:hypothetical protein
VTWLDVFVLYVTAAELAAATVSVWVPLLVCAAALAWVLCRRRRRPGTPGQAPGSRPDGPDGGAG